MLSLYSVQYCHRWREEAGLRGTIGLTQDGTSNVLTFLWMEYTHDKLKKSSVSPTNAGWIVSFHTSILLNSSSKLYLEPYTKYSGRIVQVQLEVELLLPSSSFLGKHSCFLKNGQEMIKSLYRIQHCKHASHVQYHWLRLPGWRNLKDKEAECFSEHTEWETLSSLPLPAKSKCRNVQTGH